METESLLSYEYPPRTYHTALIVPFVLCGAAPSLDALIAARCFQGLGAAAIFSVNLPIGLAAFLAGWRLLTERRHIVHSNSTCE